jgi:hypothetical protein
LGGVRHRAVVRGRGRPRRCRPGPLLPRQCDPRSAAPLGVVYQTGRRASGYARGWPPRVPDHSGMGSAAGR